MVVGRASVSCSPIFKNNLILNLHRRLPLKNYWGQWVYQQNYKLLHGMLLIVESRMFCATEEKANVVFLSKLAYFVQIRGGRFESHFTALTFLFMWRRVFREVDMLLLCKERGFD